MTKAGEASGNLNEILDQLASYLENLDDTRRKVKGAMTYPIFMVIFRMYGFGNVRLDHSKIF